MSALSVRPSHKPQSVLLGGEGPVFISADRWTLRVTPHPQLPIYFLLSIHPSTHLLLLPSTVLSLLCLAHHLSKISVPLPVVMFGKEFIMCGSPHTHLTASLVIPVSPGKPLCSSVTATHREKELRVWFYLVHSNNSMCYWFALGTVQKSIRVTHQIQTDSWAFKDGGVNMDLYFVYYLQKK